MTQPPAGGYPPPQSPQPGGYPPPAPAGPAPSTGGYPAPNTGGYPQSGSAPSGYPQPGSAPSGYPQPGSSSGYPPPAANPGPGYPPQQPPSGYPPQQPGGYPPPAGSAPAGYPGGAPGYPPQGGYPPAGAPGGYPPAGYGPPGYPPAAKPSFDASKVTIRDWIVMGAGVLLLLFSFFGWATYKYGVYVFYTYSYGAWNSYWWLGPLLGLAVGGVIAARIFMGQALPQIKPIFLVGGAALGALITLIAMIQILASSYYSPGFSLFVSLILGLGQTYFLWLWAQNQPDTKLPKLPGPAF